MWKEGITHETITPYSPESNAVAERKNKILKEMMNVLLISSLALDILWSETLIIACYLQNKTPHQKPVKHLTNYGKAIN